MKEGYRISIVVPVYNAEKYVERAMESLIGQTAFADLEVIAVDDGSNDRSGIILDDFAAIYRNISVHHIQNSGVSNARNVGIGHASAEYIGFLDADDWVDGDYYSTLLSAIKNATADIAVCGFAVETDEGTVVKNGVPKTAGAFSGREAVKEFLMGQIDVHAVTKLYRADLVRDLCFDTSLHYGEDRLFALAVMMKADRVVSVDGCYYHYYLNPQSAMQKGLSDKSFENLIVGSKTIACVREKYPELVPYAECEDINMKCRLLGEIALQDKKDNYSHYYQQLSEDVRKFNLAKAYRYSTWKHFLSLVIARTSPRLYARLRNIPYFRFKK